jgi:hypothetical protein
VQPVSSEARRNLISGVLPTEPMNPSRMSMPRLLQGRCAVIWGGRNTIGHRQVRASRGSR